MKDMLAKPVARKFINHVINKEGVPTEILPVQGTNIQSATMKELYCSQLGNKTIEDDSLSSPNGWRRGKI